MVGLNWICQLLWSCNPNKEHLFFVLLFFFDKLYLKDESNASFFFHVSDQLFGWICVKVGKSCPMSTFSEESGQFYCMIVKKNYRHWWCRNEENGDLFIHIIRNSLRSLLGQEKSGGPLLKCNDCWWTTGTNKRSASVHQCVQKLCCWLNQRLVFLLDVDK